MRTSRRLRFPTDDPGLDVVRVRPFDVATFVAFGAAQIGICGADVLMEFDYPEIYAPLDLGIGACRISVAEPAATAGSDDPRTWSRVRVATKYPNIARRHYAARGIQAEVVHLNGAMELAPSLGLARLIVDLVATGSTLRANGLVETEVIAQVTSRLIVNRTALKTRPEAIGAWIARFRAALAAHDAARHRRAPASRPPSPRCWPGARDHRRRATRRSPPSSPTCAPAATRRCCDYTARFDRLTLTADRLRIARRGDRRRGRRGPAGAAGRARPRRHADRGVPPRPAARRPDASTDAAGLTLGMRWTPLDAVGLYVPGGKAAYPSSVLMNAIPARVAGVRAHRHVRARRRTACSTRWCWRRRAAPA